PPITAREWPISTTVVAVRCARARKRNTTRAMRRTCSRVGRCGAGTRASRAPALPGEQQAARRAPADRPALRSAAADAAADSPGSTADSSRHRAAHRGRDEAESRVWTEGEAGREPQDARTAPPADRRG